MQDKVHYKKIMFPFHINLKQTCCVFVPITFGYYAYL